MPSSHLASASLHFVCSFRFCEVGRYIRRISSLFSAMKITCRRVIAVVPHPSHCEQRSPRSRLVCLCCLDRVCASFSLVTEPGASEDPPHPHPTPTCTYLPMHPQPRYLRANHQTDSSRTTLRARPRPRRDFASYLDFPI